MNVIEKLNAALQVAHNHATKDLAWISKATAEGDWTSNIGINLDYSEVVAGETVVARTSGPNHAADAQATSRAVRWMKRRAEERLRRVAADRELLAGHTDVHRCDFGEHRGGEFGPCRVVANRAKAYGIEVAG